MYTVQVMKGTLKDTYHGICDPLIRILQYDMKLFRVSYNVRVVYSIFFLATI